MIDGVGSVELMGSVMRPTPDADPRLAEPPPRWLPRPVPGAAASSSRARSAPPGRERRSPLLRAAGQARARAARDGGAHGARD